MNIEKIENLVFSTTSTAVTVSITGFVLLVLPMSTGIGCGLTLTKNVLYELNMNYYNILKNFVSKLNKLFIFCKKVSKMFKR